MKDERLYLTCIELPSGRFGVYVCTQRVYAGQHFFRQYFRQWGETKVMARYPKDWTEKQIADLVYDFFTGDQI